MMAHNTMFVIGTLLLLGATLPALAYHVDPYPSVAGLTPADWTFTLGSLVIVCESNGPLDDRNDNPSANPGTGGPCTTGEGDGTGTFAPGQGMPGTGVAASAPGSGDWVRMDVCARTVTARGLNLGDLRFTDVGTFLAGSIVAAGDFDEGESLTTGELGATDPDDIPTPVVNLNDELYADLDGDETVSVGDFRYTDVGTLPYAAGSTVSDGDGDDGDAYTSFDALAVEVGGAGVTSADNFYADVDGSGTVNAGDFRYQAVGIHAAGSTVAGGDSDDGATVAESGLKVVGGGSPALTDNIYREVLAPTTSVTGGDGTSPNGGDHRLFVGSGGYTVDEDVRAADLDLGDVFLYDEGELLRTDPVDSPDVVDLDDDLYFDDQARDYNPANVAPLGPKLSGLYGDDTDSVSGGGQFVAGACTDYSAANGDETDQHTWTARLGAFQCVIPTVSTTYSTLPGDYAFYYDRLYAWYSYDGDGYYTAGDDVGPHSGDSFAADNADTPPGLDNVDAFQGHVTVFLSTAAADHRAPPAAFSTTGSIEVVDISTLPGGRSDTAAAATSANNACGSSPSLSEDGLGGATDEPAGPVFRAVG